MKIVKSLPTNFLFMAALPAMPFFLTLSTTHARELPVRGTRNVWSGLYFQTHQSPGKNDWYAPARSPGWHEETGN
jgi:hypothetical protein